MNTLDPVKKLVREYLRTEKGLRTNGTICAWLDAKGFPVGDQELREVIHDLRVGGNPICASAKGYWWGTRNEVIQFIEEFERRVASQHLAISGMRRGLDNPLTFPAAFDQKETDKQQPLL